MPDRFGNPDDDRDDPAAARARAAEYAQAARDRELEARHAELEARAQDIAACQLCDRDGYRRPELTVVCDHIDHAPAARRGIAACRAALTKGADR